jgi:hypothetical protein
MDVLREAERLLDFGDTLAEAQAREARPPRKKRDEPRVVVGSHTGESRSLLGAGGPDFWKKNRATVRRRKRGGAA